MFFIKEVCDSSSILKVIYYSKELIKIIFILVPIGLIAMTSIDIAKNVIAKEGDMKHNFDIATKRIFMAIVIFFIPTIVGITSNLVRESINGEFLYNECLDNANKSYIVNMENEEIAQKKEEELNRKNNNTNDVSTTPVLNFSKSMSGKSLPEDDKYYPLDGKDANGNKLSYLEIDGKYLSESEMNEINSFITKSINSSEDWGTRVATAGWALAYSLSEKGLKLHYQKHGWGDSSDRSGSNCKSSSGFCNFWGKYITSSTSDIKSWCDKYGGYINYSSPKDCTTKQINEKKYYAGVDCTGFVKWSIKNGCGTGISDSQYQGNKELFTRTSNLDEAKAGDVLITDGHVIMFLKKNNDGTYMTVESSSGGPSGVFFHKYTANGLRNYQVIKMANGYNKYCKKNN